MERSHSIFGTNRHKNRRTADRGTTSADGMYLYIELVCTATTHIKQSNMDQPRKVAKPARGQLNKEVKCPCTAQMHQWQVHIYVLAQYSTAVCICLYTRYSSIEDM